LRASTAASNFSAIQESHHRLCSIIISCISPSTQVHSQTRANGGSDDSLTGPPVDPEWQRRLHSMPVPTPNPPPPPTAPDGPRTVRCRTHEGLDQQHDRLCGAAGSRLVRSAVRVREPPPSKPCRFRVCRSPFPRPRGGRVRAMGTGHQWRCGLEQHGYSMLNWATAGKMLRKSSSGKQRPSKLSAPRRGWMAMATARIRSCRMQVIGVRFLH
jgi:hypothetical protein